MADVAGLRVSHLESDVNEGVNEMVKLIAGGNTLTDSQNSRLVAYLGNLEEMRDQLATMIQYYEDDEKVLKRLLALFDSVVGALAMINNSQNGYSSTDDSGVEDVDVVKTNNTDVCPHPLSNSLVVSSAGSMLTVSKLFELGGQSEDAHHHNIEDDSDIEDDDSPWDTPVTQAELALLERDIYQPEHLADIRASTVLSPLDELVKELEEGTTLIDWNDGGNLSPPLEQHQHLSSASSSSSSGKGKKKETTCDPVECKICCDSFTLLSELHTLPCSHTYCVSCLSTLLKVLIESGGVLDLCCPQPGCGCEIKPADISLLTDTATFAKYERFVVLAALRTDPNVRWCPLPTCSNPVKGPPTDNTDWLVCNACGMNICFKCGDERHDPAECGKAAHELLAARHSNMHEAQLAFQAWKDKMKEEVKQCPGCKGFIEKNRGCNHMTCKACKYQFCWLCGSKYESGHFSNMSLFPDCNGKQYWTPPVPVDPELQKKYQWIYFPDTYQYADVDQAAARARERKSKSKAKKIGVYVGVGIAVATLGVPAAIIGGPIYGVFKLHKRLKAKKLAQRYSTAALA